MNVEHFQVRQAAVAPVPGGQHRSRVVAAAHDEARTAAVEIGDAGQEAVDAVAIIVAPVGDVAARRNVGDRGQGGAAVIAGGLVARDDLFVQTKFTFRHGQDNRVPYDADASITVQVEQSLASSLAH